MQPGTVAGRLSPAPADGEAYRFEIGGGHWIFGMDNEVRRFLRPFADMKETERRCSVFFSKKDLLVPYPLQYNTHLLGAKTRKKILDELSCFDKAGKDFNSVTLKEWLLGNFGQTLCELFFWPFNKLYTDGLYDKIAPQDNYKTPVNTGLIKSAPGKNLLLGYNAVFSYPGQGLDVLIDRMAKKCDITYQKRVTKIDIVKKKVYFNDAKAVKYNKLYSTIPLNRMMELTGLKVEAEPDPYTSVLVLNIAGVPGKRVPCDHWLFIPDSDSGFHRVGFYSNVDRAFLPKSFHRCGGRVSMYIEKAYRRGRKPSKNETARYIESVQRELTKYGFIKEVEVIDTSWIDIAYTWSWPGSFWRERALRILEKYRIFQLGRYGRWKFQGIAKSIKDGLEIVS